MQTECHEPHQDHSEVFYPTEEDDREAETDVANVTLAASTPGRCGLADREAVPTLPEPSMRDRIQYLEALFPYGAREDITNVAMAAVDTRSAALTAYDVLNPDVYGLPYLKEQYELSRNEKIPPSDRSNAFAGITELLEERAADVMRPGLFDGLSQTREYSRTVRTFAVDTSDWDAAFLAPEKSFPAFTQQHLPLTAEELARLPTCRPSQHQQHQGVSSGCGGSAARSPNRNSARRTPLPAGARKYHGSHAEGTEETPVRAAAAAKASTPTASSFEVPVLTGFESHLEEDEGKGPVAPIVRWAPKALRVGPAEAQAQQEDMFNIFENSTIFDIPFMSLGNSLHTDPPAATPGHPERRTPQNSPRTPLQKEEARRDSLAALAGDGPSSPLPALGFATPPVDVQGPSNTGDRTAREDLFPNHRSGSPPNLLQTQPGGLQPTDTLDKNHNNSFDVCTGSHSDGLASTSGPPALEQTKGRFDSGSPTDGVEVRGDGMPPTPRTLARQQLRERQKRHSTPQRVHDRMRARKPLDLVFQQTQADKACEEKKGHDKPRPTKASSPTVTSLPLVDDPDAPPFFAAAQPRRARVQRALVGGQGSHTPYGEEKDEADAPREDGRGAPEEYGNAHGGVEDGGGGGGGDAEDLSHAEDAFAFLNAEEKRLEAMERLLQPYSQIFNSAGRCYIVQHISEECPLFVERMEPIVRSLLYVVSQELTGKKLSDGMSEAPCSFPFFRNKLVSTSAIVVKRAVFDLERCEAAIDPKDAGFIKAKVRVTSLELEPIHFAYIDEAEAARQSRVACEARKRTDRRKTAEHDDYYYARGYTNGTVEVSLSKVSLSVVGTAALLLSGAVVSQIDKAKVSIGSLGLHSDVTKLNVLCTVGKPILKAIVSSALEKAIVGQHGR